MSFIDAFLQLSGKEFDRWEYPKLLTKLDYLDVERALRTLDYQHTVYGISILAHNAPELVVPHLLHFIADPRQGVFFAAERALLLIDPLCIPEDYAKLCVDACFRRREADELKPDVALMLRERYGKAH